MSWNSWNRRSRRAAAGLGRTRYGCQPARLVVDARRRGSGSDFVGSLAALERGRRRSISLRSAALHSLVEPCGSRTGSRQCGQSRVGSSWRRPLRVSRRRSPSSLRRVVLDIQSRTPRRGSLSELLVSNDRRWGGERPGTISWLQCSTASPPMHAAAAHVVSRHSICATHRRETSRAAPCRRMHSRRRPGDFCRLNAVRR